MSLRPTDRLSLRVRLALASTGVFAVTLAALGSFLYFQTKQNLDSAIDASLETRARTLAALADRSSTPSRLRSTDDFFQLLGQGNTVVAASPQNRRASLLTPPEFAHASLRPTFLWRGERARLLAVPSGSRSLGVILVGASLHQREHALEGLASSLLVGGALALLIAAGGGYWLATRALQPVERMRRRADLISQLGADQELPLPLPRDEIRRLGITLNNMLTRLHHASEHERQFIADASHELRTPLTRLRSELELARSEDTVPALRRALDSALEETERLSTLAGDLLTLASLDATAKRRHDTPVDLSELVLSCAREFGPRLARDGRTLTTDVDPALQVHGDALRLRQALDNLLENALVHGTGTVTLAAGAEDGSVMIRVNDEGPGFDADYLGKAFDRFSRAPAARGSAGTGLGLAITEAIARDHDGRAAVDNVPGGATVSLTLPNRVASPPALN